MTPNGRPLLFEAYQRFSSINDSGRHLWLRVHARADRGAAVARPRCSCRWRGRWRAGFASGQQRARDAAAHARSRPRTASGAGSPRALHDGVVQELAASLVLAVGRRRPRRAPAASKGSRRRSAGPPRRRATACGRCARCWWRSIRRAFTRPGSSAALRDLLAPLERRGVETSVTVERGLVLSPGVEAQLFRAAQEAIRNVLAHAGAHAVRVRGRLATARSRRSA